MALLGVRGATILGAFGFRAVRSVMAVILFATFIVMIVTGVLVIRGRETVQKQWLATVIVWSFLGMVGLVAGLAFAR